MTHNPANKKLDIEETLARAIFRDEHSGLQDCYDWDTAGLEDEHPGTRARYRGYAQSAIKALAAALTSPVPAGGEATPNETTLITIIADIREKSGVGSKPMLSELADAIAERITPPPSPDVAGVKLADRVDLTGGVRPAHVLESLTESVNQAWAIIGDNARCSVPATFIGWLLQEYESLSAEKGRLEAAARLRPMSDAPKNRTPVLLQVKASLPRDDLRRWEGLQFVGHHSGNWDDGFDPGWNMSAPVGHGGFPDEWFDGWRPLIARTALTPKEKA